MRNSNRKIGTRLSDRNENSPFRAIGFNELFANKTITININGEPYKVMMSKIKEYVSSHQECFRTTGGGWRVDDETGKYEKSGNGYYFLIPNEYIMSIAV